MQSVEEEEINRSELIRRSERRTVRRKPAVVKAGENRTLL